jgi:hypothetical protein
MDKYFGGNIFYFDYVVYDNSFKLLKDFTLYYFFTILYLKALSNIKYWHWEQIKNSDITCLYMEVVDLEDYGSIIAIHCKIILYSFHPKLLECFDWNTNIKELMRNL